jgi:predicted RNA-binding Zn ribbon-like protein
MSSRTVDGVVVPLPVAGHPALDFCNTRAGWNSPQPKEYLVKPQVLTVWTREAGLLGKSDAERLIAEATRAAEPAAAVLARALALREALYRAFLNRAEPADWELISAEAAAARSVSVLTPGTAGHPAGWRLVADGPERPLLAIADSAVGLLTGRLAGTVSACPGAGCGWLFSDPRGRRRWCSMAVCGNRAKARRHRVSA